MILIFLLFFPGEAYIFFSILEISKGP